jgi:hypothetical protein
MVRDEIFTINIIFCREMAQVKRRADVTWHNFQMITSLKSSNELTMCITQKFYSLNFTRTALNKFISRKVLSLMQLFCNLHLFANGM